MSVRSSKQLVLNSFVLSEVDDNMNEDMKAAIVPGVPLSPEFSPMAVDSSFLCGMQVQEETYFKKQTKRFSFFL